MTLLPYTPAHSRKQVLRCHGCRHFSAPGLSDGHCGGRDDLPRAYGKNHPLRKLPPDGGAECKRYEEK